MSDSPTRSHGGSRAIGRTSTGPLGLWVSAVAVAYLLLALACLPTPAFAEGGAFDGGSQESYVEESKPTGNLFAVNRDVHDRKVETDFYWAGNELDASGLEVGAGGNGSVAMAGNSLSLKDSKVNGSVRAAANELSLANVEVANNVTMAANRIELGPGVSAKGVYLAGNAVKYAGSCKELFVSAAEAEVAGTVSAGASLMCDRVTIGPDAKVEGVLEVPQDCDVRIDDAAETPEVTRVQRENASLSSGEALPVAVASSFGIPQTVVLLFAVAAHVLLALLFMWLMRRPIEIMAVVTRDRLAWVSLFGVVAFFATPVVVVLLLVPLVTAPVSVLLLLLMVTVWLFAIPLASAALGVRLSKGKHVWGMSAACAAFLTVLTYIPGPFVVVPSVCAAYVVGCWIQMLYLSKKTKRPKAPSA